MRTLSRAGSIIPIYFIGKRFGVASLAAWLWAVFPNAILLPVESLWDASLTALLVASIVWMTLRMTGGRWRRHAIGIRLIR